MKLLPQYHSKESFSRARKHVFDFKKKLTLVRKKSQVSKHMQA